MGCQLPTPASGGRILAAHFNHRVRGAEADADEAFVVGLCAELQVPLVARRQSAAAANVSEGSSREARYQFFREAAGESGARFVALAHTADDQAETILHRILRGTGIAGLSGIPRCRELLPGVALLRPLLDIRREEVLAYLRAIGRSYCTDSTNRDNRYTRNRIRNRLIPSLADDFNPGIVDALLRLGQQACETQGVLDRMAERLLEQCSPQFGCHEVVMASEPLRSAPPLLAREALRCLWRRCGWPEQAMGFTHWHELGALFALCPQEDGGTFHLNLPGGMVARREEDRVVLMQSRTPGCAS